MLFTTTKEKNRLERVVLFLVALMTLLYETYRMLNLKQLLYIKRALKDSPCKQNKSHSGKARRLTT